MDILKALVRFILSSLAPIIAVGIGAVIAGTGLSASSMILFWAGATIVGAGLLWGVLQYGGVDLS